jgi:D-alanyl-D-alanine carboxypeptidase/D-alanyl-D-alanine-endopeptidase (penicillin-binding protein 4)
MSVSTRTVRFISLAVLLSLSALPQTALKSKLDDAIAKSPVLSSAFVGVRVVSLNDGRVLYERNSDRLFAPASNTKLFTTALALTTLGAQYRFITTVTADQPIDSSGRLAGDLVVVGGGDPSMSPRHYPYEAPRPGQPAQPFQTIAAIEDLADQLKARGLTSIAGEIIGDDSRYIWEPYPDGWSANDAVWEYGAPVSALIVNDNAFTLWIRPGAKPGDLARLQTFPLAVPLTIDNRIVTTSGSERKIEEDRAIGSQDLQVWGHIPAADPGIDELLAVNDPAVFAAAMLRDALIRRGVDVRGEAIARHRPANENAASAPAPGIELARRTSPPLVELLQVVDKVSQNLHAEIMLREVGFVKRNAGSREAGQEEMKAFLARAGISAAEYHLVDGSGLSRLTLVSPTAITKLLVSMYRSSLRDAWIPLLPIAGVDGTLRMRFDGHPEASRIHAKTGSLSHVRALSGYAESTAWGPLAFSIIVNDSLAPSHDISVFLDTMGLKLIE